MADGYDYTEVTEWLNDWLAQNSTISESDPEKNPNSCGSLESR